MEPQDCPDFDGQDNVPFPSMAWAGCPPSPPSRPPTYFPEGLPTQFQPPLDPHAPARPPVAPPTESPPHPARLYGQGGPQLNPDQPINRLPTPQGPSPVPPQDEPQCGLDPRSWTDVPLMSGGGFVAFSPFVQSPHAGRQGGGSPRPDGSLGFPLWNPQDPNFCSTQMDSAQQCGGGKGFPKQSGGMKGQGQDEPMSQPQFSGKGWVPMPPEMQQMFVQQMYQQQQAQPQAQQQGMWHQQQQSQRQPQSGNKGGGRGDRRQQQQQGQDEWRRYGYRGGTPWTPNQANQQWQQSQSSWRSNRKWDTAQPRMSGEDTAFGAGTKGWQNSSRGGHSGKDNFNQQWYSQQQAHPHNAAAASAAAAAAEIARQPRPPQDKERGGLANTLRKVGKPSIPTKAQQLRAAKAKLRHVEPPRGQLGAAEGSETHGGASSSGAGAGSQGANAKSRGRGRGGNRGAAAPGRSLRVSWVLPGDAPSSSREADADGNGNEEGLAKIAEAMAYSDVRAVLMRLENAVAGCQVTVNLNGENSVLKGSNLGKKGGSMSAQEKRFPISPLQKPTGEGSAEDSNVCPVAKDEEQDNFDEDDASATVGGQQATDETARSAPGEDMSSGKRTARAASGQTTSLERSNEPPSPAAFAATVTLDTTEVQVKTIQELMDPDVETVDVFDTAVVLRMTDLTGDRFELTVYASGSTDVRGSAATLVHRGPVRSPESVHRIGQLEPSQVYVAWVRVFCENEIRESKQKGFKTLPARVKTIWDEPDHVILGIDAKATAKEITKAFRQLSLQFHPDKESDPEKKGAAEEHMKRLNLAKQNMMRGCPRETYVDDSEPATPAGDWDTGPMPAPDMQSPGHGQSQSSAFFNEDGGSDSSGNETGSDYSPWMPSRSPKAQSSQTQEQDTPIDDASNLCCSLRIEAAKPPKLQVIERGLTSLAIECFGLPVGGKVEVQKFHDGIWQAALPVAQVVAESMRFTLTDLQENSSYRLRLRTTVEMEPLRLTFAQFAAHEEEEVLESEEELNHEQQEEEEQDGDDGVFPCSSDLGEEDEETEET